MARSDVALRRYDDALKSFERARSIDPRAVEEPPALRDLAIAQRHAGKLAESLATYRSLVPRLGLLPGVQDRVTILLEAASVAMAHSDDGTREAISLLTEARAYPASRMDPDVFALLALALERAEAREQAAEVLELMRARGLQLQAPEPEAQTFGYLVRPADELAMYALVLERTEPGKAAEAWERFAGRETNPRWREHAKKRAEACKAAAARRPRGAAGPARPQGPGR
jgi:tetratricopeptide (TPR) repeat protein